MICYSRNRNLFDFTCRRISKGNFLIENGAFVIAAAQGGLHQDGRETFGHSLIINPWGEIIAEAEHDEPAVIIADLDIDEVVAARKKIPNLVNGRDYLSVHESGPLRKVAV